MRVGVIGRGFGQQVVAPAFSATEGCEVVDVVSPRDGDAVAALCARTDVDLISVHSPPFLHLDHVRRAVESDHAVLCDKPFGRNTAEATEMRDLAVAAGVPHFLNFENRYDPARQCARAAVIDGVVGDPEHVAYRMIMAIWRTPLRAYGWLFDGQAGGGWLRSIGSHQIDFTRWVFGEIVDGTGVLQTVIPERPDRDGKPVAVTADDSFSAAFRTDRGVRAVIDSSAVAPMHVGLSMLVVGSGGVIEETGNAVVARTADGERDLFRADGAGNPLLTAMETYAGVVRDAVHDGETPPGVPTFDDGLACVVAMDRVSASGGSS